MEVVDRTPSLVLHSPLGRPSEEADCSDPETALDTPTSVQDASQWSTRWSVSSAWSRYSASRKRNSEVPQIPSLSKIHSLKTPSSHRVSLPPIPLFASAPTLARPHSRSRSPSPSPSQLPPPPPPPHHFATDEYAVYHPQSDDSVHDKDAHPVDPSLGPIHSSLPLESVKDEALDVPPQHHQSAESQSHHASPDDESIGPEFSPIHVRRLLALIDTFYANMTNAYNIYRDNLAPAVENHPTSSERYQDDALTFCTQLRSMLLEKNDRKERHGGHLKRATNNVSSARCLRPVCNNGHQNTRPWPKTLRYQRSRRFGPLPLSSELAKHQAHLSALHAVELEKETAVQELQLLQRQVEVQVKLAQKPLEEQLDTLKTSLAVCEEEKQECEFALEALQNEMQSVLEELEETRQQRNQYKAEADQLRQSLTSLHEADGSTDGLAAKLLVENAAQRTLDIERENKRQSLVIEQQRTELRQLKEQQHKMKVECTAAERQLRAAHSSQAQAEQAALKATEVQHQLEQQLANTQKRLAETELKMEVAKSQAKKQLDQSQEKIKHLTEQLHHAMGDALKVQLQAAAEQRVQRDLELQVALQRKVAERDADVARLNKLLQQTEQQTANKMATLTAQMERERSAWEKLRYEEMEAQFRKQQDVYQVNVTRELRQAAGHIAELECQVEQLEQRQREDAMVVRRAEHHCTQAKQQLEESQGTWRALEEDLQTTIATLQLRIAKLEEDTLGLYSKNLKLAHQLGQYAP